MRLAEPRARLTVVTVAYPLAPVTEEAGGAEQIAASLDRALVDAGHRSVVVADERSRAAGTLVPFAAEPGLLDDAARNRAHARMRRVLDAALPEADIVHFHGFDFPAYLPRSSPPLMATLHLPLAWCGDLPCDGSVALHTVSETQQREAAALGLTTRLIRNGVDLDRLRPAPRAATRRLLTLTRICPEKAPHLAAEAARRAGAPLDIAGPLYPYRAHLDYAERVLQPALDSDRQWIGAIGSEEKRQKLAAARALLIPSQAPETSSLVAMEAAACGTPVIAFPSGALAEIVRHGVTGFLVGSISEMADAIDAVDEIDRAACRHEAEKHFDLARTLAAYLARYAALAREPATC